MLHDINQYGVHREHKATSTLKAMTKAELIEYIRMLEHDYNVAVDFNEQQARNIEQMMKDGRLAEVIRCKDCIRYGDEYVVGAGWCDEHEHLTNDDDYCSYAVGKLSEMECVK